MKKTTRLVLADPLRLVAEGIRELLKAHYTHVDLATDGRALLEIATSGDSASQIPDLILTAVSIPEIGGLQVTRRLHRIRPTVPVLILAETSDQDCARAAFEAGARGFLAKTVAPQELLRAVEEVLAGRPYMSPAIAGKVLSSLFSTVPKPNKGPMTPREREIAELVTQGLETAEIASRLFIAEVTVRTHLRRILRKLGLRNRVELTRHVLDERSRGRFQRARLVS